MGKRGRASILARRSRHSAIHQANPDSSPQPLDGAGDGFAALEQPRRVRGVLRAVTEHGVVVRQLQQLLGFRVSALAEHLLQPVVVLDGTAEPLSDDESRLRFAGHEIRASGQCEGEVKFMVRPELLRVQPSGSRDENTVEAMLTEIADRGAYQRLELDAGLPLIVYVPVGGQTQPLVPGQKYHIVFPPDAIHVLERSSRVP